LDIDFAFICDYAEATAKISALGIGFDTIFAQKVPTVHPHFHLVAQIRASIAEVGDKDLVVRLIDADGNDVIPEVKGTINVTQPKEGMTESIGRLSMGFNNIQFPKYSEYSLHVVIQGSEMVRIPLRVAQPPSTT
jgi:hypothetical protein